MFASCAYHSCVCIYIYICVMLCFICFLFLLRFSCVALLSLFCSWETSSLLLVLFTTNTWIRTKLKLYKWLAQKHWTLYQSNLFYINVFLNVCVYGIIVLIMYNIFMTLLLKCCQRSASSVHGLILLSEDFCKRVKG